MPRIAVGGFLHETNTFAPSRATFEMFLQGGGWPALSEGEAMYASLRVAGSSSFRFEAAGSGSAAFARLADELHRATGPHPADLG